MTKTIELIPQELDFTKQLKARAKEIADQLPERLLKGDKAARGKTIYRKRKRIELDWIEQSYDQLDGEWAEWLAVAKRYEHRVPSQDRADMRHTIILELAKARNRDGKPIPILRAYRIASLMVALYWREANKASVKVCIYDGLPKEPHCLTCKHKNAGGGECPYLALRPVQSLDGEATDEQGNQTRLIETVADDTAIDVEAWLDANLWLLSCPMRLVQIGCKKLKGIPLNARDRKYLSRYRQQEQARLF